MIREDELERLHSCLSRARESIDDPTGFLNADLELHSIIVEASRNPLLIGIMASISSLGPATRQRTAYISGVREVVSEHHARIVEALGSGDPEASRRAMEEHISHIEDALRGVAGEEGSLEGFEI
jgi:DNA-binding FadR family transcriptional regulator